MQDSRRSWHLPIDTTRSTIGWIAAPVTVIIAALTAVGFLGGIWWGFDLAAKFRVQYTLVLLISSAVLAVVHRWWAIGVAAMALMVNLALIVPLYAGAPAPRSTRPDSRS